jgi:hypothetical protein
MNVLGFLFTVVNAGLMLRLPRCWAPLPLLFAAVFMTRGQVLEIGPAHFTVIRVLVLVGLLRIYLRRERIGGGVNWLDRLIILWSVWMAISSVFHSPFSASLVFHLGLAYEYLGIYWLMRVFIQDAEDVFRIGKATLLLLIPLTLEMLMEKMTDQNYFSFFGGVFEHAEIRNGRVRAQGPFAHSILAGTAGAVCMPLAFLYWQQNRKVALAGLAATGGIVLACASSGPIMTVGSILGAMALWKVRHLLVSIRWAVILGIIGLAIIMNDPVYYLLARIDLAGGSTGYYRAALIGAAIKHFKEWWFAGTDYTRHWLETGAVNPNHVDLVNHYIAMGVMGGLPLMLLFMVALYVAFAAIGKELNPDTPTGRQFLAWTLGSILFGHATTFVSVSYFDQTVVFLYMLLASIGSLRSRQLAMVSAPVEESAWPVPECETSAKC